MILWLWRWLYGCDHNYQFVGHYNTWDSTSSYIVYKTSIHRCTKCMKAKRDKFT